MYYNIVDFKDDKLDVLVNVNIVTEGVDVPNVQTVFLTRPTKSKILMTQMIGRGLRGTKVGGTAITYIVDFLDKWQDDLVAWVIPEKLHKEEEIIEPVVVVGAGQSEQELSDLEILRTISEGKLAEFINLANSTFNLSAFEKFSLIERIPIGYYSFDYEFTTEDGDGGTKSCTVLLYDCMKPLFDELMNWLANRTEKNSLKLNQLQMRLMKNFSVSVNNFSATAKTISATFYIFMFKIMANCRNLLSSPIAMNMMLLR